LFLGIKFAPYTDELDSFELSRSISQPEAPAAATPVTEHESYENESMRDLEKDASDRDGEGQSTPPTKAAQQKPAANVVGWTGPEDADNPQNWSSTKKSFVFIQICLLTFSIYSASAIITPAEPVFEEMYGITPQVSALVLSMYVLGYGTGPLIFRFA
jgi:DHA1 family multidrug resistance protein-like MFS transporter